MISRIQEDDVVYDCDEPHYWYMYFRLKIVNTVWNSILSQKYQLPLKCAGGENKKHEIYYQFDSHIFDQGNPYPSPSNKDSLTI